MNYTAEQLEAGAGVLESSELDTEWITPTSLAKIAAKVADAMLAAAPAEKIERQALTPSASFLKKNRK